MWQLQILMLQRGLFNLRQVSYGDLISILFHRGPGAGSDRKKKVTPVSRYHHLISLIKNRLEVSCETHVVVDFQLVIFREGASFMSKIQSDSYRRRHGQTDRQTELCSLGSPQVHLLSPSSGIEPQREVFSTIYIQYALIYLPPQWAIMLEIYICIYQHMTDVATGKFMMRPLRWWGRICPPGWNRVEVSEILTYFCQYMVSNQERFLFEKGKCK